MTCMHAKSLQLCPTLHNPIAHSLEAPLSIRFSRQEYQRALPCHSPRDLPDSGIKSRSVKSPALADGFFTTSATWGAHWMGGEHGGILNAISKGKKPSQKGYMIPTI